MKYDNIKCPVCGDTFTAESDVVVCPECGTPHHRSCYEELGQCTNHAEHENGYMWRMEDLPSDVLKQIEEKKDHIEPPKIYSGVNASPKEAPNGSIPGLEIDKDGKATPVYRRIGANEKIGDYTVADYGKVIKRNVHKYIPCFIITDRTQRKMSWNWAAFFFGPAWLIYRKMYKYGIIAIILCSILPLIFIGDVLDYADKCEATISNMSEVLMSDASTSDKEIKSETDAIIANSPEEPVAITISNYIGVIISAVLGAFGNYLYMEHCKKVLDSASKLKENPLARDAELERRGGTSLGMVIFSYLVILIIYALVTLLAIEIGSDLATILRRFI